MLRRLVYVTLKKDKEFNKKVLNIHQLSEVLRLLDSIFLEVEEVWVWDELILNKINVYKYMYYMFCHLCSLYHFGRISILLN